MLPREYVNYEDKLYWVYRKVKHYQVKEGSINDLKEFWLCDMVVRNKNQNDDTLLFMREIEEAVIVS
jgi:predicted nucleotide-binding protein (sugar kinase/HSP70/actin superfamily)